MTRSLFISKSVEVLDWFRPARFAAHVPEEQYLSRFYGTFSQRTHIVCRTIPKWIRMNESPMTSVKHTSQYEQLMSLSVINAQAQ